MSEKLNRLLLGISLVLLLAGLIVLMSASAIIGEQDYGDVYYFIKRQLLQGVLGGVILVWLASKIDYHIWKKLSFFLLAINILLLLMCFLPTFHPPGTPTSRGLKIGPIILQPAEFLKISLIAFISGLLSNYPPAKRRKITSRPFIIFFCAIGLVGIIIFKQPATGTLLVLAISTLAIYFSAGLTALQFLFICLSGLMALALVIIKSPYRYERITSFLSPQKDPLGKGYHIIQSLIGIGSGGIFGVGFGRSVQRFNYLPESHTDAIFSIIAEEFGFIGSTVVITLFLIFLVTGLKIAKNAEDSFGRFLAIGLTCSITAQAFINIAAMCKLLPITGIPLPFFSYGSSSLITTLISVGILSRIAKRS